MRSTMMHNSSSRFGFVIVLMIALISGCREEHRFIKSTAFKGQAEIVVTFAGPVDKEWAENPVNYKLYEQSDPDILIKLKHAKMSSNKTSVILSFDEALNQKEPHVLTMSDIRSEGGYLGTAIVRVKKAYVGYLLSILIGAMVINNFVFTKYLGLCVFFGTSKRKSTAVGMGVTFTIVIVVSTIMSWALYQFILKPFQLSFLQVVVFIGMVSLSVQAVDTVLRKVNPKLFKAFGVYLVLVIANCVIIAVPLMVADSELNALESFTLALGSGIGFLIALFLMSSVRERLELANIPQSFRGLPIAFVLGGFFALAFLGFSGMSLF